MKRCEEKEVDQILKLNKKKKSVTFKRMRAEPTCISCHPARFTCHKSFDSENINIPNFHMVLPWPCDESGHVSLRMRASQCKSAPFLVWC